MYGERAIALALFLSSLLAQVPTLSGLNFIWKRAHGMNLDLSSLVRIELYLYNNSHLLEIEKVKETKKIFVRMYLRRYFFIRHKIDSIK